MVIIKKIGKVFDILGKLFAVLTIILTAFLLINGQYNLFTDTSILQLLLTIQEYAILATLAVVVLGFACKSNFVIFLLFCLIIIVVVVYSFPAIYTLLPF